MKLSDFKPGQIAYISESRDLSYPVRVKAVTKDHVIVSEDGFERSFFLYGKSGLPQAQLIEEGNADGPVYLFPSRMAIREYDDRVALLAWMRGASLVQRVRALPTEKLRELRAVLEPQEEKRKKGKAE